MRRHEFLRELHKLVRPRNYLEIGVNDGRSLSLSRVPSIAVDPDFAVTVPIRCDVELVRATSDDFFAAKDPIRHLRSSRNPLRNARRGRPLFDHWRGGTTIDLAFIDGMHWFEFALRDFMNVERFARATSVIVFDDMLPREIVEASRGARPGAWAGDVYKTSLALREYRPDLTLIPVDTAPTGVLIVLGADPSNRVLHERYDDILARWTADDPQDVPEPILRRADAFDPERLIRSRLWSWLAAARHRGGERAIAKVRAELPRLLAGPRE